MRKKILDILKCQQCLGTLTFLEDRFVCHNCKIEYPISKGLIFMGYDKNKKNEIEKTITTERDHQTNLEEIQKHYDYARPSFKIALLAIDILKHDIDIYEDNPIAIDIGSGGAPMSKILSEYGFDTYRCELDPNSLYSGLFWKHPNLEVGKHIVCDACLLPFGDGSIDVVYCKEFVHHVEDYNHLMMEINRVLKQNGIFLMIEPTLTILNRFRHWFFKAFEELHGHHYQTISKYYLSLKRNGFLPYRYYLYSYGKSKKLKLLNILKNYLNRQICTGVKTATIDVFLKMRIQDLIGGSNVIFSKKMANILQTRKRPDIQIVKPSQLILDENYLADVRLEKFIEILKDVYEEVLS
jgi:ubiquinone/menaquinone biosynthesis C-methylase UbiE